MSWVKQIRTGLSILVIAFFVLPINVLAQTSSTSPNYRVDQTFFGSGGELDASSTNFRSKQTLGELGVGNTASTSYQAFAGFNTDAEPFIEFVVSGATIDLGVLDTAQVRTATGNFAVRAWNASGYVVQTQSDPPKNSASPKTLNTTTTPTASAPGTEQFGINLVLNSNFCGAGCNLGANPLQQPDSTFSFGTAAAGYNTANLFKYVKGDIVASSNKSTSITNYTVSYLYNINNSTPSGLYVFNHVLVATGTY